MGLTVRAPLAMSALNYAAFETIGTLRFEAHDVPSLRHP